MTPFCLDSRLTLPLISNTLLTLLCSGSVWYLYLFQPAQYVPFVIEDGWAEYGTCVSWGVAFCVLLVVLWQYAQLRTLGLVSLTLAAFFIAMEEISWGQRFFGYETPAFLMTGNTQGEANLHNLINTNAPIYYTLTRLGLIVWCVVPWALVRVSPLVRSWCAHSGVPIIPVRLWPFFLLASAFLGIDVFPFGYEIGELFFGLAIACLALDMALAGHGWRRSVLVQTTASAGMLAGLVVLTVLVLPYLPGPRNTKLHLQHFATFALPDRGMHEQALMVFDYIEQHKEFFQVDTPLNKSMVLMEMGHEAEAQETLKPYVRYLRTRPRQGGAALPRLLGKMYCLLNRPEQARQQLVWAQQADEARLKRTTNPEHQAHLHWSLAATLLALNQKTAAEEQLSQALALAPHPALQVRLKDLFWAERRVQRFLQCGL